MLAISILIAYVRPGIAMIFGDLGKSQIDRPFWTRQPTIFNMALMTLIWPIRLFVDLKLQNMSTPKRACLAAAGLVAQVIPGAFLIFESLKLSEQIVESSLLRILSSVILTAICLPLSALIATIVYMPLHLLIEVLLTERRL